MRARVLLGLLLAGCQGTQTLWVVTEHPEPLTVTVGGKLHELELRTLQAYSRLSLEKGADVVVRGAGGELDRGRVPPVPKGMMALYFVQGAPTLHLVDYRKLAGINRPKDRGPAQPVSEEEIELVAADPTTHVVLMPEASVLVGPEAPLPAGGKVNPRSFEKYPIYRVERVPEGADVSAVVRARATEELGLTRLLGK